MPGAFKRCNYFLEVLTLVHVSSKKKCLKGHSTYNLKAHRISNNNTVLTYQHRGKREKVTTIRKVIKKIQDFSGPDH